MSSYPPPCRNAVSLLAVASMVFDILAWIVLPFTGALVAIVRGRLTRGEICRSPIDNRMEGDGMAVTWLALGYVQMALCGIFLLMGVLIFGFAFAAGY